MSPIRLRLQEMRERKGLSQAELARQSGISRVTINRLERGHNTGFDLATLEALANSLGVNAAALIEHRRKRSPR